MSERGVKEQVVQSVGKQSLIIDDRERKVFRVPRKAYVDEQIWEMEKKKIFDKCWLYIGHESELLKPGDFKRRRIGGRELIFNRDTDGNVNAILNTCPHRGAMVCREDEGRTKVFQCFYHAWTFDTKGELIGYPGSREGCYPEDFNCDGALNMIKVAKLEQYRGFYFVNYDPNSVSLEQYLGQAKEYLDLVADQSPKGMEIVSGEQRYSIRANWKLLMENSCDGNHGLPTHKTYFEYLRGRDGSLAAGEELYGSARDLGDGHGVGEYFAAWGRPTAKWIPAWGEDGKKELEEIRAELIQLHGEERGNRIAQQNRNILIFPNLVINDIMATTVRVIDPISPDYMEIKAWALAPVGESEKFRERRLLNFLEFLGPGGFASPDDNEALELCQVGFRNHREAEWSDISKGLTRGTPTADVDEVADESPIRAIWRQWNKLMMEE